MTMTTGVGELVISVIDFQNINAVESMKGRTRSFEALVLILP